MWGEKLGGLFQAITVPPAPDNLPETKTRNGANGAAKPEDLFMLDDNPPMLDESDLSAAVSAAFPRHAANWGAPVGAAPIASTLSVAVQPAEAPMVASRVRKVTETKVIHAWSELKSEFGVQKLVWDSMKMTRGKDKTYQDKIASLTAIYTEAIEAHSRTDSKQVLDLLQHALKIGDPENAEISKGMIEATQAVVKQTTTHAVEHRKELADRLDQVAALGDIPMTTSDAEKTRLKELVKKCELGDDKLERTVKKHLQIQEPKSDGVTKKGSAPLGAAVSGASHSKLSQKPRRNSNSVGAPAKGPTMSSMMRKLPPPSANLGMPAADGGTRSNLGAAALDTGIMSDLPPSVKANKASEKISKLAADKIEKSWQEIKAEFSVQKLVWESLALHKKVDLKETSKFETTFQGAIAARVKSPTMALQTMEQLLQGHGSGRPDDVMSKSMAIAIRNVVDQAAATDFRIQLAERVATAGVPATLPTTPEDKKEVETLVVASKLDDAKLERSVRRMMLLPIPPELASSSSSGTKASSLGSSVGSKVSSRPLGSGVSQKDSRRSNSTSGIKANKQNKPIADRIRENHVELPFDPPQRLHMEL